MVEKNRKNTDSLLRQLDAGGWSSLVGSNVVQSASRGIVINQTTPRSETEFPLPEDIAGLLTTLSESKGISKEEVLRRAIAAAAYIDEAQAQGGKFFLQKPDRSIRELRFQ